LGEGGRSHKSSLWWKDLKEVWASEGWGRSFEDDFKWKGYFFLGGQVVG